jgi:hypothetical protein
MFGLKGSEGSLKLPVFEMIGNHDKVTKGPWVGDQVTARHGGRFYSWNWDDVHLVARCPYVRRGPCDRHEVDARLVRLGKRGMGLDLREAADTTSVEQGRRPTRQLSA